MKIADYGIQMNAKYQKVELYHKEERLEIWSEKRQEPKNQKGLPGLVDDMLELSDEAMQKMKNDALKQLNAVEGQEEIELDDPELQKVMILKALLERMTGKKFRFLVPQKINPDKNKSEAQIMGQKNAPNQPQGWSIAYDLKESYYQKEQMSFAADGVVKTADGREINFSIQLNMSKEFAYQNQISFRAGDLVKVDPLVIHFDTTNPSLTEKKYEFDLDADGQLDKISFVSPGSGFLALDKNGDGIINDGTELFGPQTGNGFLELAAYDEDGNGWIDENDSIYNQLVIWTKDENGEDQLFALGEKGIGAIYLGHLATPFALTDAQQQEQGEIAQTGIFLKENGQAGLIQHIDLVV